MCCAIGCYEGSARLPIVPYQPVNQVQLPFLEDFPGSGLWPSHNQLQNASIFGRLSNFLEPRLQLIHNKVIHTRHRQPSPLLVFSQPSMQLSQVQGSGFKSDCK
jgi:hypothetical protein